MADMEKSAEEAKRLLGLLFSADEQLQPTDVEGTKSVPLFSDGETIRNKPQKSAVITTKRMNTYKQPKHTWKDNPELNDIVIDVDAGTIQGPEHFGPWLMPMDIAILLKNGCFERTADEDTGVPPEALDQVEEVDYTNALPNTNTRVIAEGKPGYWMHFTEGRLAGKVLPVYGYMWDLGYRAASSPDIPVTMDLRKTDWHNCTWLQRCAQCGRELPPAAYYRLNGPGQDRRQCLTAICSSCTLLNHNAKRFWDRSFVNRTIEEQAFLDEYLHMLEVVWKRGLSPRGKVAKDYLGTERVMQRVYDSRRLGEIKGHRHKPEFITRHKAFMDAILGWEEPTDDDDDYDAEDEDA